MKKIIFVIISITISILVLFALFSQKKQTEVLENKPLVTATVFPLYDIVRVVGEGVVQTELILPPGASPHTFEMNPKTVRLIEQSRRVFAIGHGLDSWVTNFIPTNETLVIADNGIELKASTEKHEDAETDEAQQEDGSTDPHYWLDVQNGIQIAQTVAEELQRLVPEQTSRISENLRVYTKELNALDESIQTQLSGVENKKMITFHSAWYYFADAYGLEISATFEPQAGREPTPQYLAELSNTIKNTGVQILYAEPQFSSSGVKAFLSNQKVSIVTIDPIGGTVETDSYVNLMRSNVYIISQNQY